MWNQITSNEETIMITMRVKKLPTKKLQVKYITNKKKLISESLQINIIDNQWWKQWAGMMASMRKGYGGAERDWEIDGERKRNKKRERGETVKTSKIQLQECYLSRKVWRVDWHYSRLMVIAVVGGSSLYAGGHVPASNSTLSWWSSCSLWTATTNIIIFF